MKKIISMVLSIVILCSIAAPAIAVSVDSKEVDVKEMLREELGESFVDDARVNIVQHDLEILNLYVPYDNIAIAGLSNDGGMSYIIEHENGITNLATVKENSNGDISFVFTEGDKQDNILIAADGTVFLDGHEVTVEITSEASLGNFKNNVTIPISRAAGFSNYYTLSNSSLTNYKYHSDQAGSRISFGKVLGAMTLSGVSTVFSSTLGNIIRGVSIIIDMSALAVSTAVSSMGALAAQDIFSVAEKYKNTTYATVNIARYNHNSNNAALYRYKYKFSYLLKGNVVSTRWVYHERYPR